MKVAFFIGTLNRGGTEMLVLDVFQKKQLAPFEMVLIYRNDGELSDAYRATGVPMFRIKPHGSKLRHLQEIRTLLKKERIDILHAQTLTNGLFGIACTSFSRVKLVFTFHGLFLAHKLDWIRHLIVWKADAVIFVSRFIQDWYSNHTLLYPRKRCSVVYNGINFDKLSIAYPEPTFFRGYEANRVLRLAMVGNFVNGRSQIVVCKGLKQLREKGVDFHFYFIGGKKEREPWLFDQCVAFCEQNGLSDQVHFVGSRGDVPAILQHIDGFVFSTIRDTFGIAVIEAVSAGVPTLTNDWAVMKEISCEGLYFDLFRTGDENDCCLKMQQLIADQVNRKRKAFINGAAIKEIYSIDNHIIALGRIYSKICG